MQPTSIMQSAPYIPQSDTTMSGQPTTVPLLYDAGGIHLMCEEDTRAHSDEKIYHYYDNDKLEMFIHTFPSRNESRRFLFSADHFMSISHLCNNNKLRMMESYCVNDVVPKSLWIWDSDQQLIYKYINDKTYIVIHCYCDRQEIDKHLRKYRGRMIVDDSPNLYCRILADQLTTAEQYNIVYILREILTPVTFRPV